MIQKLKSLVIFLSFSLLIGPASATTQETVKEHAKLISNKIITLKDLPKLEIDKNYAKTSHLVSQLVSFYHYKKDFSFDDKFSRQAFDAYLEQLDPGRMYLTAEDVQSFSKYQNKIDDAIYDGDVSLAFDIFEKFRKRWIERYQYALHLLDQKFDFTKNETFRYDRKDVAWSENQSELNELWRKRVKNDVIMQLLNDKTLDEAKEKLHKRYIASMRRMSQTESKDVFRYFMTAVTQTVEPHTLYFSPRAADKFNTEMSLSLEGIGAVLQTEDVDTKIVRLVPGGPAKRSKQLSKDDIILSVGQGDKGPLQDVIGWRIDDVVELIKGKAGSTVRLEVMTPDSAANGDTRIVKIVREKIKLEDQDAQSKIIEIKQDGKLRQFGVIELPKFYIDYDEYVKGNPNYKSTTRDVHKLIDELKAKHVDGIIMDLRNNGGGSLMEATQLTGLFIKQGPVVQERDFKNRIRVHPDVDPSIAYDGPLVVLVNRFSASASEIFAGAIQDYGRGLIVGSTTFGKGTIQQIRNLDEWNRRSPGTHLGQLKFTAARFYRISGDSTQIKGVKPDVTMPSLIDAKEYGEASLTNSLPWDQISAANYQHTDLHNVLPKILANHKKRLDRDPEFKLLDEEYSAYKTIREEKTTSLNLETRRAEREKSKAESLVRLNKRRKFEGLPALAKLDDEEDDNDEDDEEHKFDPVLTEAGRIMSDFISIEQQTEKLAAAKVN